MKLLEPIHPPEALEIKIASRIEQHFLLFLMPLVDILNDFDFKSPVLNSMNDVINAIMRGDIYRDGNTIKGQFNRKISTEMKRLGATFNKKTKSWRLPVMPPEFSSAFAMVDSKMSAIVDMLTQTLENMDFSDDDYTDLFDDAVSMVDERFKRTVKQTTIAPVLTESAKAAIAREWSNNLNLYIKDFSRKEILSLREKVRQNVYQGQRAENLQSMIQVAYGRSKAKAKFLARQETSLLTSKLREQRYRDVGISRYRWSTSKDERVRPMHNDLHGKIFSFDSPPITDEDGNRNNPGEDFGCRCVAIPIVD